MQGHSQTGFPTFKIFNRLNKNAKKVNMKDGEWQNIGVQRSRVLPQMGL